MRTRLIVMTMMLASCGAGQGTAGPPGAGVAGELSDLVAPEARGKQDTGYYSNVAVELDGAIAGRIELADDASGRRALDDAEFRDTLVQLQLRYAKNGLKAYGLHLNLTAANADVLAPRREGGKIVFVYKIAIETIVTKADLEAGGVRSADELTGQLVRFDAPADPREVFARAGALCASNYKTLDDLTEENYFYYFDSKKQACAQRVPLTRGAFSIRATLPKKTAYPEYDRLAADGRIDVAAYFGAAHAADDGSVSAHDAGLRAWRAFRETLLARGFAISGTADDASAMGERFVRTRASLTETVNVIGPDDLAKPHADPAVLARLIHNNEIIIYAGHAFYGSLDLLDEPSTYPKDRYQIFFMSACWTYEYYTKQIFRNKATASDPSGWTNADVVNDTEVGWFNNYAAVSRILLTNLLRGAETGGREGERRYHWGNIVTSLNKHAFDAYTQYGYRTHELFGVSGVRTNTFTPR
ncbi:MAG: hypothetical protein KC503_03040 [Myxococcales bacterium]|nr:hypothetical protein [Myxococcales bacterium]